MYNVQWKTNFPLMLFPKEARSAWEGGRKSPLWGGDLEEAMMQDVSGVMRGDPSENTETVNGKL